LLDIKNIAAANFGQLAGFLGLSPKKAEGSNGEGEMEDR
jgi:hypothetical protein